MIPAGDFNNRGGLASHCPLQDSLRDVWPLAGSGWGATFMNNWPVARIDQCWISEGISPVAAWVAQSDLSDHLPLVVEVRL